MGSLLILPDLKSHVKSSFSRDIASALSQGVGVQEQKQEQGNPAPDKVAGPTQAFFDILDFFHDPVKIAQEKEKFRPFILGKVVGLQFFCPVHAIGYFLLWLKTLHDLQSLLTVNSPIPALSRDP